MCMCVVTDWLLQGYWVCLDSSCMLCLPIEGSPETHSARGRQLWDLFFPSQGASCETHRDAFSALDVGPTGLSCAHSHSWWSDKALIRGQVPPMFFRTMKPLSGTGLILHSLLWCFGSIQIQLSPLLLVEKLISVHTAFHEDCWKIGSNALIQSRICVSKC